MEEIEFDNRVKLKKKKGGGGGQAHVSYHKDLCSEIHAYTHLYSSCHLSSVIVMLWIQSL